MIVSKFSVWLRETARLYLRYMAVALGSIPFAVGAALSRQAGWNQNIILPFALVCGLVTAFVLWKWMGDWQVKPKVATGAFETDVSVITAVFKNVGLSHPTQVSCHGDSLISWHDLLSPMLVEGQSDAQFYKILLREGLHERPLTLGHQLRMFDLLMWNGSGASIAVQMKSSSPTAFHEMLVGRRIPSLHSKTTRSNVPLEVQPQRATPAALILGGYTGAQGLA